VKERIEQRCVQFDVTVHSAARHGVCLSPGGGNEKRVGKKNNKTTFLKTE
jgi:hypothetical protein